MIIELTAQHAPKLLEPERVDRLHAICHGDPKEMHYDDFVEMRVGGDDWSGRGLDEVGEVRVGKPLAQGGHGRRRENHVAYLPETNQQDLQGSMLASSMSMTGMSSLIG